MHPSSNEQQCKEFSDSSEEEKWGPDEPDELYDEEADNADEQWVNKHLRRETTRSGKQIAPESDAVLNCPCCFTTICMDCQRHIRYKNQYRAMFVSNCTVKYNKKVVPPPVADSSSGKSSKKIKRGKASQKREEESTGEQQQQPQQGKEAAGGTQKQEGQEREVRWEGEGDGKEVFYPVVCSCCGTEVGMQDQEEIYHFFNVIAS